MRSCTFRLDVTAFPSGVRTIPVEATETVAPVMFRRREFREMVFTLVLCFVLCFACYVVFPVQGPRYLWVDSGDIPVGPVRALTLRLLESNSSRGTAFPSSHVAVAAAQSLLALRYWRRRGLPVLVVTLGLALGAVICV